MPIAASGSRPLRSSGNCPYLVGSAAVTGRSGAEVDQSQSATSGYSRTRLSTSIPHLRWFSGGVLKAAGRATEACGVILSLLVCSTASDNSMPSRVSSMNAFGFVDETIARVREQSLHNLQSGATMIGG